MDLSKLPDSQRQELEQLQKQFQEHQAQQQKQQQFAAAVQQPPPPAYDPFQVHHSYDPSRAYDQSYYSNYQPRSQHHHHHQQQQQSQQQYDASYYQNYYSNSYQHHQYTHSGTSQAMAPNEQQRNEESGSRSLGLGRVQDPYLNQVNLGERQPNPGYNGPPALNHAAAAAVAALSQHLTQFAGTMGAPMAGGEFSYQGHFRHPVGHTSYRGGGRRGGGPFRGGDRGNSGFRPPNTGITGPPFHGKRRGRGRGRDGRRGPPFGAPSSQPESSAQANAQPTARIAWCELCRVDCTCEELLDQHNNGRRHKKNLQKLQDRKGASQPVAETKSDAKPGSDIGLELLENIPENEPDKQTKVGDDNNIVETKENGNPEKKHRMKRKMRDRVRGSRGSRGGAKRIRPTGPRIRKVVIPLMCDLCNVKCDTQEVFDKHAAGKKHISKLRRFEGHQAMYGATAVQALYPPNPLSQTLGPQPAAHNGAPSSYSAPPEAYIPLPQQAENPNPQLADAPLEFGTQTHASNGFQ